MTRIVVIEDNQQNARMAEKLLKQAGYEITLAEDGESGMIAVMEIMPDLVLIDLGLPDVDGQTIVAMMRQQPELAQTPIIAFTAWPEETATAMARAYGCDGVINKPIDTRLFAKQVESFLHITTQS
jgi:two-component system cell cycle response regulator DivK